MYEYISRVVEISPRVSSSRRSTISFFPFSLNNFLYDRLLLQSLPPLRGNNFFLAVSYIFYYANTFVDYTRRQKMSLTRRRPRLDFSSRASNNPPLIRLEGATKKTKNLGAIPKRLGTTETG